MAIAEHHPDEVNPENRGVLKMNHKQLHDFSSTKEKGLPEHVKKHAEHGGAAEDHKAAVSKMHPEHVHNLVKHAASGKFGPEAQQMAQQAQQAPQAPPEGDGDADDQPQGRDMSSIFSGGSPQPAQPSAPASRASMFAGRSGGY